MTSDERQALALAGVFQAASIVDELARTGQYDQRAWETLIRATIETDPETFDAIYGRDISNLKRGIDTASQLLESAPHGSEVMRYSMSLLLLSCRMRKDNDMLERISQRLQRIQQQAIHFGATHENSVLALGQLYQDTLSTLRYRIIVHGNPQLVASAHMADRIRAVLLAGIRFAVLWHQEGGRRWQLLLSRSRIRKTLGSLHQSLT